MMGAIFGRKKPKIDFFHAPKKILGLKKSMRKKILNLKKSMHQKNLPRDPMEKKHLGILHFSFFWWHGKNDHNLVFQNLKCDPQEFPESMVFQNLRFKNTSAGSKNLQATGCRFFPFSTVAATSKVHVSLFQGFALLQGFAFLKAYSYFFTHLCATSVQLALALALGLVPATSQN